MTGVGQHARQANARLTLQQICQQTLTGLPYEYMGVQHTYYLDFLVRLTAAMTVVLEIKGYEDDQDKAKHQAAMRWVAAVNNWGELGKWAFHVCRDPQLLQTELATFTA